MPSWHEPFRVYTCREVVVLPLLESPFESSRAMLSLPLLAFTRAFAVIVVHVATIATIANIANITNVAIVLQVGRPFPFSLPRYAAPRADFLATLRLKTPSTISYLLVDPRVTKATLRFIFDSGRFDSYYSPPSPP
ncbi:hypothetical protein JCM10908_006291 [Rhodotorula pacifica]|uniref:uncharacterized protein n=1 Tax=Rhodotorula pacifica TaxID=1495444 RepID=UPI00317BA943